MIQNLDWKINQSQKIIKAALKKWRKNLAVAFTGGKDSTVMLHLVKSVTSKLPPAFFIDHKLHFKETYDFVKKLKNKWNFKLLFEAEKKALEKMLGEKNLPKKRELSRLLKISTIQDAISKHNWQALLVGIRWDEHPARSKEEYIKAHQKHFRIHPILHFREKDIWDYIRRFKLPYNPLYDQGYRSLGEKPFTKPVPGSKKSERAGREKDKEKIMARLRSLGYF